MNIGNGGRQGEPGNRPQVRKSGRIRPHEARSWKSVGATGAIRHGGTELRGPERSRPPFCRWAVGCLPCWNHIVDPGEQVASWARQIAPIWSKSANIAPNGSLADLGKLQTQSGQLVEIAQKTAQIRPKSGQLWSKPHVLVRMRHSPAKSAQVRPGLDQFGDFDRNWPECQTWPGIRPTWMHNIA